MPYQSSTSYSSIGGVSEIQVGQDTASGSVNFAGSVSYTPETNTVNFTGGGGGFDPTANITFTGIDSFDSPVSVATPASPQHAVNLQYLNNYTAQNTTLGFKIMDTTLTPTFAAGEEYILFPTDIGGYVEFDLTLLGQYKTGATSYGEVTAKFSIEHDSATSYNSASIKLLSLGQSGVAQNLTNLFTFTAYLTNAPYVINGVTLPNPSVIYTVKLNNTLNYAGTTNSIYSKINSNSVSAYNGMTGAYTPAVLAIVSTPITGSAAVIKADTSLFQSSLDVNNFGTNPTTGLTTLTNIQTATSTISPVINDYIMLVPLNVSLPASVRLNLVLLWTGGTLQIEIDIFRDSYLKINDFRCTAGSITTVPLFNTLFEFSLDSARYVSLKSLTAITGLEVIVRYVSDTPTPVTNIPLIGTIYTPTSPIVISNYWASTVGVTGNTMITDPTTGFLRNGSVYSADHSWTSTTTSPAIPANSYILLAALNWNTLSAGCIINFGEDDYLSYGQFALHINFQGGVPANATVLSFNSGSGSVLGTYANFLANWSIQYAIDNVHNSINVYLVNKNDIFPASPTAKFIFSKLDILAISGIPVYWLPLIGSIVTAPPSPTKLALTSSSAVNIDNATLGVNPTSGLTHTTGNTNSISKATTNITTGVELLLAVPAAGSDSYDGYMDVKIVFNNGGSSVVEFGGNIIAGNDRRTEFNLDYFYSINTLDNGSENWAAFNKYFQLRDVWDTANSAWYLTLKFISLLPNMTANQSATITISTRGQTADLLNQYLANTTYLPQFLNVFPTGITPTPTVSTVPSQIHPHLTDMDFSGVTLGINPTTGLIQGLVGGDYPSQTIPTVAAGSYVLILPNSNLGGNVFSFAVQDLTGYFYMTIAMFEKTASVLFFNGTSAYVTYVAAIANYSLYFDSSTNYILVKSINTATNFLVRVTAGNIPLLAAQISNIGTIVTPVTPNPIVLTLASAVNIDGATLGVNPKSGLTQGLVGGANTGAVIPSLANPSYVLLNPATTNFGGFVNMKIQDAAGDCYLNFAIGGTFANIVNYQGAGAYTTLAGFQAAYKFYKDSNNYLYIQPVGTVTNFICYVVNGFSPLVAAQIPNIGTVQTCNTPKLVAFSQLTTSVEMQSTIDSLTARLEALESPKTPLKAAKK